MSVKSRTYYTNKLNNGLINHNFQLCTPKLYIYSTQFIIIEVDQNPPVLLGGGSLVLFGGGSWCLVNELEAGVC